jgi:hypothetical protein
LTSYKDKVIFALSKAPNIDTVHEIADKIKVTSQVNRRTKLGRALTEELLTLCNNKVDELVEAGELPF